MNTTELDRSLRLLRLGGMAGVLETRIQQAQAARMSHIDFIAALVGDELVRREDRLLERRLKAATFRDPGRTLDTFDFDFNKKIDRHLVFELSTARFVERHEDVLMLGPPGTGKSHLAQAIGQAAIKQDHRVLYRETHHLLEELAESTLDGTPRDTMEKLSTAPLLIIDDLGMRKLPRRQRPMTCSSHHAAVREDVDDPDVKPASRGLGQDARRRRRGDRDARSPAASRPRTQVRATELANEGAIVARCDVSGERERLTLASRGEVAIENPRLGRALTGRI